MFSKYTVIFRFLTLEILFRYVVKLISNMFYVLTHEISKNIPFEVQFSRVF